MRAFLHDAAESLHLAQWHVDLESRDAERPGALALVIEECRTDAKSSLGLLFVVRGVAFGAHTFEVIQERRHVGQCLRGVYRHAGFGDELTNLWLIHLGEDRQGRHNDFEPVARKLVCREQSVVFPGDQNVAEALAGDGQYDQAQAVAYSITDPRSQARALAKVAGAEKIQVTDREVLLGPPIKFTKENIDKYDF